MTRSARIERIANIEEQREKEAARALAQALEALSQRENTLAQLQSYHQEYSDRDRLTQAASTSAVVLQDFKFFLEKLSTAITQQTQLVASTRESVEQLRGALQSANRRANSLATAAQRYRTLEAHASARREQALLDEIGAMRRHIPLM